MKKILLMHRLRFEDQMERLEKQFEVITIRSSDDAQKIIDENQDIVAIFSIVGRQITANIIESLPNLEIISVYGVGYDHIDLDKAKEREIVVTNTPNIVTRDTADTALALILNISRRFVESDIYVRVGKWLAGNKPVGRAVWEKKVGILGLGRIGKAIALRAEAFDMDIAYTATKIKNDVPYVYYNDPVKLAENCDYLVVACPGGEKTKHLVNKDVLKALGENGYLINIARGSVVNTEDLIWALENKIIAGAGLDVFENEPFVPEALLSMDNVVLLPHMGTATEETLYLQGEMVLANLEAYFKGEKLPSQVI
ncbi:MAG: hypothetical protein CMH30_03040 [Micavibrio sp.]|nr:hypothetical protein [Micavibrio sp.]|tara:strand:+ start:1127 stop:2062 length:936 start_codon:yes stop_codon:yes gene_type:complete